jgi:hypothetical protein
MGRRWGGGTATTHGRSYGLQSGRTAVSASPPRISRGVVDGLSGDTELRLWG